MIMLIQIELYENDITYERYELSIVKKVLMWLRLNRKTKMRMYFR